MERLNIKRIVGGRPAWWLLLFLTYGGSVAAQSIYSCTGGPVSFFSSAPLEDIEASSENLNSMLNTETLEIVFIVPIRTFSFRKSLMEEHFNERYLESHKYPNATYRGQLSGDIDLSKDGEYAVYSTGTLDLHGVSKVRTDTGTLVVRDGMYSLSGRFDVRLSDHEIEIPKLVISNIAEVVEVRFKAAYTPFRKKK